MPTHYLTHAKHGAMHAYDQGEIERLTKLGWTVGTEPTGAEILAAKRSKIAERLRAELAALEAPVAEAPAVAEAAPAVKKKPGRKAKVAA